MNKPRIGYRWGKGRVCGNPTSWVIDILSVGDEACNITDQLIAHQMGWEDYA